MSAASVASIDPLPGNWLAKQLRGVYEDTDGLIDHIPRTPESRQSAHGPYMSLFEITYGPRDIHIERLSDRTYEKPKPRPQSVGRNNPQPSKMFMNWKVPTRLTNEYTKAAQGRATNPDKTDDIVHQELASAFKNMGVQPPSVYEVPKTQDPTHTTHFVPPVVHSMHDKVRSAGLPRIPSADPRPEMASRQSSRRPPSRDNDRVSLPRSAGSVMERGSAYRLKTSQSADQPRPKSKSVHTPDIWKTQYSKGVIERAIRQSKRYAELDRTLHKSLLPDAKQAAMKWLTSATDADRQVALQFFKSIAGTKLMGTTNEEQLMRLDQLLDGLKRGRPVGAFMLPRYKGPERVDPTSRLQYVRLLSPNTRRDRPMHTTWHHLPVHPEKNRVENRSSIYTEPQAPIPHHFVIHPDWG